MNLPRWVVRTQSGRELVVYGVGPHEEARAFAQEVAGDADPVVAIDGPFECRGQRIDLGAPMHASAAAGESREQ